ncbi:5-formyltetrahydrofolate cyclo-ligase [Aliarcobacter cibarius]|jgi:5-formyltetrahydrofolate cyclo-ligase|uniref:5-formyltetrahydrofolate cyclo-ligase n=1 Tax=Aliarcobacter cibarius TaxID=255507 RepID=A0A5J6RHA5_9BACT|nr:5-formyltetrahydrofolate cyclo-ligase [Aliarcobacter cibarius]QEZ89446.1 5-formyltetrahydrofolate cycloligase [Aliarcobacter cibarius]QKJ27445.1 5-formyltetrahydrofolate cycloligase [Aliarcobacter cibarius]TLS98805.1 5-formyltetrahydrofolate cyclo-ligase [Aliarcobacter cibarius]TLS99600.1 5-formyltetrahydrofolate cyclo-ligase [Aliarcobacter cibarius]TLT04335.1 5-formyltetrahydrofolate cyclo-ligase [Aliarcobacter cibarius]
MNTNHKSDFRISSIKRLRFCSSFKRYSKSKKIVEKLKYIIKKEGAENILLFVPLELEVNIKPLILELRKAKKKVYVPFMQDDSFKMVKYRLPLQKRRFGIYEPNNSFMKPVKIDLAVVPIVGVDALNKRIGFGKGMYDRFFYRLKYKPTIVFTQLVLCKSEKILSDNYDIEADYIITG